MILDKYFDIIDVLNLDAATEAAITEATCAMIESINGFWYKEDRPVLPLRVNGKVIEELATLNKNQFKAFLDNISSLTRQKTYIIDAFNVLVEGYSWTPSDVGNSYAFGGNAGAEMLGTSGPLWDMYDPFKLATGSATPPRDNGGGPMGFEQNPVRSMQPEHEKVNYPKAVMKSSNGIKRIMGNAQNRIPVAKEAGFYAPWWIYNNFQNSQQLFT